MSCGPPLTHLAAPCSPRAVTASLSVRALCCLDSLVSPLEHGYCSNSIGKTKSKLRQALSKVADTTCLPAACSGCLEGTASGI